MTFHSVGKVIIPFDFHIFQRGRYTTNQKMWVKHGKIIGKTRASSGNHVSISHDHSLID